MPIVQFEDALNTTLEAEEAPLPANLRDAAGLDEGALSGLLTGNTTASRAIVSDSNGKLGVSAVTATELGYVSGVTSAIQTQLDARVSKTGSIMTGPLIFQPAVNTTTRGIMAEFVGPDTGSYAGAFLFNQIAATWKAEVTGSGLPGASGSATVVGTQFNLTVGGPNYSATSAMAIASGLIHTEDDTSAGDKVGGGFGVYSEAETGDRIYGATTGVTLVSGHVSPQAMGLEVDTHLFGTASVTNAVGINSWSGGDAQATNFYSAYSIGVSGEVGAAQWKQGFLLYTGEGETGTPIATTGSLFASDHTTTIANIFDFDNVDVTGHILNFPRVTLTGDGVLSLGSNAAAGGVGLNGPAATALLETFSQAGSAKWQFGIGANSDIVFTNSVLGNVGLRIASADNAITTLGTINSATIDENAWTTMSPAPTITSGSGTITAYTSSGKYRRLFGRTIIACVRATLTTVGTASGPLLYTLPVNSVTGAPIVGAFGREGGTTGKGLSGGRHSATQGNCYFSDGTSVFTGGNGTIVDITIIYEAAS